MIILIVAVVSVLIVGVGIFGLISPAGVAAFVSVWKSKTGLWIAVIVRLGFGIALWLVAPMSRAPLALEVLAVISVSAAIMLPLIGISRYQSIVAWWSRRSPLFIRVWSVVALGLGIFILWSIMICSR
ncbi:MAG: hypothetical protein NTZ78_08130 [Candidatus Aureabacteria bacterium]|nr:hypothetical protein [Candidatus Auribacterota bacterium]